ncbi:MAG: SDR family oxidoreductase, partial [Actinomycetota bacterium]
ADIATTLQISALSLASLVGALEPLLSAASTSGGASVVGLTFAPDRVWPGYGWMGIAKGTLQSIAKSLAVEHGPSSIRVNLVDAGPMRTAAARSIPGSQRAFSDWSARAPLGWDENDATAIAEACILLLSSALSKTTGTTLIVDGGAHAVGN